MEGPQITIVAMDGSEVCRLAMTPALSVLGVKEHLSHVTGAHVAEQDLVFSEDMGMMNDSTLLSQTCSESVTATVVYTGGQCVLLTAKTTSLENQSRIRDIENILKGRGVNFEAIDGSDPANLDLRSQLFEISSRHAEYPQVFLRGRTGHYTFLGAHAEVQQANEVSAMLKEHPELRENPEAARSTFEHLFRSCTSMVS
eukprot:gb/GFBE01035331.1/.p1 GENE.gb/GFBE01035331.1/~~gb/GFBE01035331.1/.p1  ORF type:complete len:199 (+),score=27.66 gb/GFBE01035331.1/:1-597(+)